MKSRSHWLPVSEPHHDDWVDGSWTVDCICGVNYDDGEEMVNCDECGVWVHTRCSRYVKSEKSFACDKCKNKNASGGVNRNYTEETEVAEFLVELPTKTLIMDNPNPSSVSSFMPIRLCAPMEERVHVQGVPGGDPDLFSGLKMSSVFGPQLWKSTGYVPKKFNFRYTEFPCLDDDKAMEKKDEEVNTRNDIGHVDQADNGAGCLLSLSKENGNNFPAPLVDSVGLKSSVEAARFHEVQRHKKKLDIKNLDSACPENSVKKESRSKQPIVIYSGKHMKDESRMSRDQSTKKRVRSTEQEIDVQRPAAHASEAASTFSSDAERLEFSQGKVSNAVLDNYRHGKDVLTDQLSDDLGECATNLAANECGPVVTLTDSVTSNEISKEVIGGKELRVIVPDKEEIIGDDLQSRGDIGEDAGRVGVSICNKESMDGAVKVTRSDVEESETAQDTNTYEDKSRPIKKLKAEQLDSMKLDNMKDATQHPQLSPNVIEDCKAIETSVVKSEASDHKVHDESLGHTSNQERTALEGPSKPRKRPSVTKHGSEVAEEPLKSNSGVTYTSRASYQCKLVVKSASTSTSVISKSSNKDVIASTAQNPTSDSGQKELSEKSTDNMSETKTVRADKMFFRTRKLVKDSSRLNSVSNVSQVTKSPSSLDSKRTLSDSQDIKLHSGDSSSSPLIEGAADVQNKATGSVPPVKGEKFYQSGNHSLTRGNVGSTNAPTHPNVPATLSDEELALLLHQELNSSPRVPRVPRMRHAGSLPQVACPTATSLLIKRTSSSSVGKDQGVLYKRKSKDFSRDASHGSVETDNEAKKMEKKPSSLDKRKRDTGVYPVSRREVDKDVHSNKLTNVSNSLSSSSNDANVQNLSTNRSSSRKASVNDSQMVGRSTNRTLPGLKKTSYEEHCSAVLPTSSSRRRRNTDADSLNNETEDNAAHAKGARSKGFESRQEELEFPLKGKRNARKGARRPALQGRGIVKRRRRADVVSDDESKSYPNSSDEDNMPSSEEEIQGGGSETSSSSDDD